MFKVHCCWFVDRMFDCFQCQFQCNQSAQEGDHKLKCAQRERRRSNCLFLFVFHFLSVQIKITALTVFLEFFIY